MKHTFKCDECMLITIPLGALEVEEGELVRGQITCVFRDVYKVFIMKGKPKSVGVAQAIVGLFLLGLDLLLYQSRLPWMFQGHPWMFVNILFIVSGMLTCAAGHFPNMYVAKLSFIGNIISFFWSVAAVTIMLCTRNNPPLTVDDGINGLITALLFVEMGLTLFLNYWFSQCPVIKLDGRLKKTCP